MIHLFLHNIYVVIGFFAIVEGPIVAICAGVGFALGYVNPFAGYAIVLGGAIVQDVAYYWLGRWAASVEKVREIATRTRLIRKNFLTLETAWRKDMLVTLALSKFAYGLYAPFIISAGMSAVPFRKFMLASIGMAMVVIGFWCGVGYGFAKLYGTGGDFGRYAVIGLGIVAIVAMFFVMRHARRHLDPKQARRKSNVIGHGGEAKSAH
jgi:membrane protein DedA with SNARE-associated domain